MSFPTPRAKYGTESWPSIQGNLEKQSAISNGSMMSFVPTAPTDVSDGSGMVKPYSNLPS